MENKSILQVIVEEEYQRCLDHLSNLLSKYQMTEGNKRMRYNIMIDSRIRSTKFAMKCLDIEESEDVLIQAEKLTNYKNKEDIK